MHLISELKNPFSVHGYGRLNNGSPNMTQPPKHGRRDFIDVIKDLQSDYSGSSGWVPWIHKGPLKEARELKEK